MIRFSAVIQISSVLLLLTLASVVRSQTLPRCGIAAMEGPAEVGSGEPLVFKVKITGLIHTTKPEFKWNLSAGAIAAGQGTDQITVDTVGVGGLDLTITVELAGAPPGCNGSTSKTTHVKSPGFICGLAFDRYGDIQFEDEKARLDNFAIQLYNDPLSSGYIVVSAGQKTFENEAAEQLDRAKSYLVNVREIDPNRVVTVDCGFSTELDVKLYIAPLGALPPTCSDFSAVPLSDVKFTKPRPKATKKQR